MDSKVLLVRGHLRPTGQSSPEIRSIRSHTENIWLRTKRYNATGKVVSGTGGVCYLYFPAQLLPDQKLALGSIGVR